MNHRSIIAQRAEEIPLSLYVHFPWCLSKCPYCDFNSYPLANSTDISIYIDKLLLDLELSAAHCQKHTLISIYFGGGTPSLLTPQDISLIINGAKKNLSFAHDSEITLEANPGTISLELLREFKSAGINRLSLGVQSFNDDNLIKIRRIHSAQDAIDAIQAIILVGFTSYNLDLMFGLPNQNVKGALRDLANAIQFKPPHLSWYQYTVKPNPELPSDDELWHMQQRGEKLLAKNGYDHYEVAAFARASKSRSKHNMNYWQFGDYLGIGAGAHGKITFQDYQVKRYAKISNPHKYIKSANFIETQEIVAKEKLPLEFMLNALRLYQPIPFDLFAKSTGQKIEVLTPKLYIAQKMGLLKLQDKTLIATKKGRDFLNDLLEIFL